MISGLIPGLTVGILGVITRDFPEYGKKSCVMASVSTLNSPNDFKYGDYLDYKWCGMGGFKL
jgi:hypothetical protein